MNETQVPRNQCSARSRKGVQCTNLAIPGGSVCRYHGGAAPQVMALARKRLALMIDPSLEVLERTLNNKKRPELALRAATDVLDRTGFKAKDKLELSNEPGKTFNLSVLTDEQLGQLEALVASASVSGGEETPGTPED